MERLYQIIARHFSQSEIEDLSNILSIYVPPNSEPNAMARELFLGARRNLRLDVLFREVYSYKASLGLDLGPNLYELIAGTFNEQEAVELARKLGFDRLSVGLNASGLIGWNNDNFYKRQKAETIQNTAEEQGKFGALLDAMKSIRPNLDLTIFKQSALAQGEPQKGDDPKPLDPQSVGDSTKGEKPTVQYVIYGDHIQGDKVGGDQVGGDKVGGDKAGGDIFKGISISGISGSAISFGGDAVVGTQVKDTQGDVTIGQPPDRDALMVLMSQINQDLAALKSELRGRDAAEAAETLQEVEEEIENRKTRCGLDSSKAEKRG